MKTFLDSGVLLTAWRGKEAAAAAALALLEAPGRTFYTSKVVKLELLPKPTHFKQQAEVDFYNTIFARMAGEEPWSAELGAAAFDLACRHGLSAADALNMTAALRQGADEFVTSEGPNKALFRVPGIRVQTIRQAARI